MLRSPDECIFLSPLIETIQRIDQERKKAKSDENLPDVKFSFAESTFSPCGDWGIRIVPP
jgi:hypothetical protein